MADQDACWCCKPAGHRITRCDEVCDIACLTCDTLVTLLYIKPGFKCKDGGYCDREEGRRRRRQHHAREIQKVEVTRPRAPKEVDNLGKYDASRLGGSGGLTTTIPPSSLASSFITDSTYPIGKSSD